MTAFAQSAVSQGISERIFAPLRRVRGRQWVMRAGRAACQLLLVSLTAWLAVALLLGCLPSLPAVARVALSAVAWVALIGAAALFLPAAFRRRNLSDVAQDVEQTLPHADELLSSAVELSAVSDPRFAASEELVAHLMQQAEEAAKTVHPETIVSFRTLARWLAYLTPVVIAWSVLAPLMPVPMLRGLYRIVHPWDPELPAYLALVRVTPGNATLAQGDTLEITASVATGIGLKPEVARATLLTKYTGGQMVSADLSRTEARAFHGSLEGVQQDFSYQVSTEQGESPWYHVHVLVRPTVGGIEVRYVYPGYTHWKPRQETRNDGVIDALVGTQAQLVIHSSQPLDARSQLVIGENPKDQTFAPLVPVLGSKQNDYAAALTVQKSGSYRVALVNADALGNKDELPRSILARPDQPPAVQITSPKGTPTVPVDDTVPVQYKASDDIGLAKVEAFVQVDGRAAQAFPISFSSPDGMKTQGRWLLSLPYVLARMSISDANEVTYQLRATDNRDPNPQSSFSTKNVLRIQHATTQSFVTKQEQEAAHDLTEAIKDTIAALAADQQKLDPLTKEAPARIPAAKERMAMAAVKDDLVQAGKTLAEAARENEQGPMADLAKAAEQIADRPVARAADEMAAAMLSAEHPEARAKDLAASEKDVAAAKKQLEDLLAAAQKAEKQAEVARALEDLAHHQDEIARKMEQNPRDNSNPQKEQALRQDLEQLLNQHPELNTQQAREMADRTEQLVRRIEDQERQQKQLDEPVARQTPLKAAEEKVESLAQKQKDLNKEIAAFEKKDQAPIKAANAPQPPEQRQEQIVQQLEKDKPSEAFNNQQQTANELHQASEQMKQAAQDGAAAQNERQAKQDEQNVEQIKKQAQAVAQQLKKAEAEQAQNPKDQNAQNAVKQLDQQIQQLAQQAQQEAAQMQGREPDEKQALEAAKQELAQAQQDAQQGNGDKAEQELEQALGKLEAAAEQQAAADEQQKQQLADASKEAANLSKDQQALAQETAKAAEAMNQAMAQANPQGLAQQEEQQSQQAQAAADEAKQLAQQEQANAPDAAQEAKEAQAALQQAAQAEKQVAQAAKDSNPQAAADAQKGAEQALAKAERALRGLPENADAQKQGDGQPQDPNAQADADGQGEKPDGGNEPGENAQAMDQSGEHAGEHAPEGAAKGESGEGDHAGEGAAKGEPGQGDHAGKPAGAHPEAGDAHAGNEPPHAGAPHAGTEPGAHAGQHAGQPGAAHATPAQLAQQAARQVQQARAAQDEATQNNLQAAQEAAVALHQAAKNLADAIPALTPASPDNTPPDNDTAQARAMQASATLDDSPQQDTQASREEGGAHSTANPNSRTKDGHGIALRGMRASDSRPPEVKALGLSPSDWAHLPALAQAQLLNAAQQGGAPGYQEMIKNYYSRIAKLQGEEK